MTRYRISSAVLLTRGQGPELELYLVERSRQLRFFGGYWAVPGGVLDALDSVPGEAVEAGPQERCALRELFEETGVLLGGLGADWSTGQREEARRLLLEEERAPWSAGDAELERARAALRYLCTVRTPPFSAVRYLTRYYHAELPAQELPTIWSGELTQGRFWRPAELWRAWKAGELHVVPPVLALVELLVEHGALDEELFQRALASTRAMQDGHLVAPQVSPGVRLIALRTPTLPPATTTNCLAVGEARRYLIDPATWEEAERQRLFELLDGWRAQGVRFAGVIATHHHRDHVGSIAAVARRYGLPVHAHPLTLARLPEAVDDARTLVDGEELELGTSPDGRPDWRLRALHTPGHDRGHLALLETRHRTLIAGDMLSTLSTIVIDPPEGHLATYLASLARLVELAPRVLVPAHGPAHPRAVELLEAYLEHRGVRERALLRELGHGPAPLQALLPRVYADVADALLPVAARSLQAGLEKLQEEGRAQEHAGRWELVPGGPPLA